LIKTFTKLHHFFKINKKLNFEGYSDNDRMKLNSKKKIHNVLSEDGNRKTTHYFQINLLFAPCIFTISSNEPFYYQSDQMSPRIFHFSQLNTIY